MTVGRLVTVVQFVVVRSELCFKTGVAADTGHESTIPLVPAKPSRGWSAGAGEASSLKAAAKQILLVVEMLIIISGNGAAIGPRPLSKYFTSVPPNWRSSSSSCRRATSPPTL